MPDLTIDFSDVAKPAKRGGFDAPITGRWGDPRDGGKRTHHALDLAYSEGEPIAVNKPGRVVKRGEDEKSGKFLFLDHGDGQVSSYSHLQGWDAEEGEEIEPGRAFARVGRTATKSPHLHFVVRRNGERVDPEQTDIRPMRGGAPTNKGSVDFSDVAQAVDFSDVTTPQPAGAERQEAAQAPGPPATLPRYRDPSSFVRPNVSSFPAYVSTGDLVPPHVEPKPEDFVREATDYTIDRPVIGTAPPAPTPPLPPPRPARVRTPTKPDAAADVERQLPAAAPQAAPAPVTAADPVTASREFLRHYGAQQGLTDPAALDAFVEDAVSKTGSGFFKEDGSPLSAEEFGQLRASGFEGAGVRRGVPELLASHLTRQQETADADEARARTALADEIEHARVDALLEAQRAGLPGEDAARAAQLAMEAKEQELAGQGGGTLRGEVARRARAGALEARAAAGDPLAQLELGGRLAAEAGRGARDVVGSTLQGGGVMQELAARSNITSGLTLDDALGLLVSGVSGKPVRRAMSAEETLLYGAGADVKKAFGEDSDLAPEFIAQVARGGGSSVPFFLLGAATGGSGAVAGLLGAVSQAGDTYSELTKQGVSGDARLAGALAALPVGASEMFGLGETFNRVTGGLFVRSFARFLKDTGREATEEALQEFFQTAAGESIVQLASDRDPTLRGKLSNLWGRSGEIAGKAGKAAGVAAFVGAAGGAGTSAAHQTSGADTEAFPTAPVPESPETLKAQFRSAKDSNSPRAAVLVTPGEQVPTKVPKGFIAATLDDGSTLYLSREKAEGLGLTTPEAIQTFVAANGVAPLIGKVAPVEDTSQGAALRTEDAKGVELSTSIVPMPEAVEAQAEVDRASFPEAARQAVMPAQEAAARRDPRLEAIARAAEEAEAIEVRLFGEGGLYDSGKGPEEQSPAYHAAQEEAAAARDRALRAIAELVLDPAARFDEKTPGVGVYAEPEYRERLAEWFPDIAAKYATKETAARRQEKPVHAVDFSDVATPTQEIPNERQSSNRTGATRTQPAILAPAGDVPQVADRGADRVREAGARESDRATSSFSEDEGEAPQAQAENQVVSQPREFEHTQFGRVTEEGPAGKGKVKVVDEQGQSHIIQEPKANGRGNERAVPVKRTGIVIKPKAASEFRPQTTAQAPEGKSYRVLWADGRAVQYFDNLEAAEKFKDDKLASDDEPGAPTLIDTPKGARVKSEYVPVATTQEAPRYTRRKAAPKVEAAPAKPLRGAAAREEAVRQAEAGIRESVKRARKDGRSEVYILPQMRVEINGKTSLIPTGFIVQKLGLGRGSNVNYYKTGAAEAEQPSKAEARASGKLEKVNARTGLTETQTDYLAGELEKAAEGLPATAEVGTPEASRHRVREGTAVEIKVPGDGEFVVYSRAGANKLHQKITGKPIEGFERATGTGLHPATNAPRLTAKERLANTDVDEVVRAYGSAQKAHDALVKVQKQLESDPAAAEQMGGDAARMEGLIEELRERTDAERPIEEVRAPLAAAVNARISAHSAFADLKATVDRMRQRAWRGDKAAFAKGDRTTLDRTTGVTSRVLVIEKLADAPLKMARADEKRVDELRAAEFTDLVPSATVERTNHLLEVNAEGHEILRRAFEQNLINRGEVEGEPESAFDGVFLTPQQIKDSVRSLKDAAREMRDYGYEGAERLDDFARELIAAGKAGKGTAIAYVFDYAVPHEEFHRAGYQGAVGEALSSRHANFTELAGHRAVQKAWDNYFNRVPGYSRTDEALLVEETAAWIAGGKAETLGLTEDEAADYLERWFESYALKNGDEALANFAEGTLPHVREIIEQVRAGRADRRANQGGVPEGVEGVPRQPEEEARRAQRTDKAGAQEAKAVGVRSLPSTLREQGLRAADELYEIYPDKAATADAKRLLEDLGFEGSVKLLESDLQHGAEHVQLSKILQRALLAEASRIADEDADEASHLRERQQELASTLSARMTRAGQYIHSAGVVDSSAEDVMATAARVAKERGRSLSPREAERVHRAGEDLERAAAELEIASQAAREARRVVTEDTETLARAEEGLLTKREIETLRKRLASLRAKEKGREERIATLDALMPRRPRKPASRASTRRQAADLLAADEADLMADVMASLGMSPLKMARAEGEANPQGAPPRPLDPDTLDKLARLGALRLLRAEKGSLTVKDFKRGMVADFGAQIKPEVDEIHARAVRIAGETVRAARRERTLERIAEREGNEDLSREDLEEIAREETRARRLVAAAQVEHDREARKHDRQGVSSRALAEAIGRNAADEEEAKAAARLAADPASATKADLPAARVLEAARREIRESRDLAAALKDSAAQTAAERDQALASLLQARKQRAEATRKVAQELKRIKKGAVRTVAGEVWRGMKGVPISLMASGEFSHMLRQGGVGVVMKPSLLPGFVRATGESIREQGFARNVDRIEQDEDFALMQRMGLDFAFAGESKGEEFFEGAEVLHRIPIVKQTVGKFVEKSDHVFGGGLDHLRYALAKMWIDELRAGNVTFAERPQAYKDVGRFINIITGRADIGDHNTAATRAYLALGRMVGFAPRYRVSRLQFLTLPLNSSFWNADPSARRIVYKNVARWYGTMGGTFTALAALGWLTGVQLISLLDPDDDDWLKLKIGKQRIDLTSGNQTHLRTVVRLLMESYRGMTGQVTGKMAGERMFEIGVRWMHSGSDPRLSLGIEWYTGETYNREPFTWFGDYYLDGAIGTRLTPITYNNAVKTTLKEGPLYGATQTAAEFVGLNSNVYPDREEPKTTGEKLAMRFAEREFRGKPLDEETKRKLGDLKTRARAGEDVSAALEPLVVAEKITERRAESIAAAKDQTLLQEKFRILSLEDARHVWKYLTPEERRQVGDIVRDKELKAAAKTAREEKAAENPEREKRKKERAKRAAEKRRRKQELKYGRDLPTYAP